jgi:hypothetical protein
MSRHGEILEGLTTARLEEANSKFTNPPNFKEVIFIKGEYTKGKKPYEYVKFKLFQVDGKYYEVLNKDYIPNASNFYSAVGNSAKYPANSLDVKKVTITKF